MLGAVVRHAAWAVLGCAASTAAQAALISGVTPQGEVAQVRQVVLRFNESVVPFGDLRLPDPARVSCQGTSVQGRGRWSTDREWLFDFKEALPPGTRCSVKARTDWRPQQCALTGKTEFKFQTGGPAVVRQWPGEGATVEEGQYYLFLLGGAAPIWRALAQQLRAGRPSRAPALPAGVVAAAAVSMRSTPISRLPHRRSRSKANTARGCSMAGISGRARSWRGRPGRDGMCWR